MGLAIGSIVFRVSDLQGQMAFWTAALGYVPRDEPSADFVVLRDPAGRGVNVSLDAHHSEYRLPPRIHLDLYADDQTAEVERLTALGAKRVYWDRQPAGSDYVIMEDPEGNRFCVVQV